MKRKFLAILAILALVVIMIPAATAGAGDDGPSLLPGTRFTFDNGEEEEGGKELFWRDDDFISKRIAGDIPLDNQQAGALRAAAARAAARLRKEGIPTAGPSTFSGDWAAIGPKPIGEFTRSSFSLIPMNGRIGALAIRQDGTMILGGAQGGIWIFDASTSTWVPKTGALGEENIPSLSMGALAVAPSNDMVVYAGTGEGALSGDSYFGNGVLKSTDGGETWAHVSGDYFVGVSISQLVVHPTDANTLYVSVLSGIGGSRSARPAVHSAYGLWKSTDGGVNWTRLRVNKSQAVEKAARATDIEIDPQNPNILYASFLGDAIYKSTNGGNTWFPIMNFDLPSPNFAAASTRFSIDLSHPSPGGDGTLYAGFDWVDADGYHPSRVFKSTDGGASWMMLPGGADPDKVEDYCGGQCWYDNVIEAAPDDENVVFAGGQFDYGIDSGGIFRSDDGGLTWKNLGWDQHPDFHALAFDPNDSNKVLVGSDGGVWYSTDRGGRPNASDPLSAVTWQNLNGFGLQIAQFTSVATVPQIPGKFWGGTQDNGTLQKYFPSSRTWYDMTSGDGGQVLVDHTVDGTCEFGTPGPSCYIYGTYYGISPYRIADGGAYFFNNNGITTGINTNDRSEFYIPFVLNQENTNQLFLGTYRLYRTDNARAASSGDVLWTPISGDLTLGCTPPTRAPNGARCNITAIGIGGGQAVYTGSGGGLVYVSTDAQVNDNPTWTRVGLGHLPNRSITGFAVDRSNYRIAYIAYSGFNAATPSTPGHVFRTLDGGQTWADISGDLPDSPVNSIVLDPSYPNTLYAGTDVGPFVTYNGGADWYSLGQGFPIIAIHQLDLDTVNRVLAAGTHGRGAFSITDDAGNAAPALVISKVSADVPVGPSSQLQYTITVKNEGNADAVDVVVSDPVPANTTFASASDGGALAGNVVTWPAVDIAAGSRITRTFTVSVADALKNKVKSIVNDGFRADASGGFYTTGSPVVSSISDPYAVSATPATQTTGAKVGNSVDYFVHVTNLGYNTDSYNMSTAGGTYTVSLLDATCTSALSVTASLSPGTSADVCARVEVPANAPNSELNTASIIATSVANPAISASAIVNTIAVGTNTNTLLVDGDGNGPDVQSYYSTALSDAGISFNVWDLSDDSNLPQSYMLAFDNIVWFTGNVWPDPIVPYEARLTAFLDNGGHLFMSGQDILDQNAGTHAFVYDYLHIDWNGSEDQNDIFTSNINAVAGTLTDGLGTVPLDHSVLNAAYEDQITPIAPAVTIFTDDASGPNGLSYTDGYKVVFLAFPFEGYGTAGQKADLMSRVFTFFGP